MLVSFIKINPKEYKLHVKRDNGTEDEAVLDYRSFLKHDLVHLVIESEARLSNSFFGQVASGKALASFLPENMKEQSGKYSELGEIEKIVGLIQGALKQTNLDTTELVEYYTSQIEAPVFFTVEFVDAVLQEVRQYLKRYEALHVGGSLDLEFK